MPKRIWQTSTDRFDDPDNNSCNAYNITQAPPANYIRDPAWNEHITADGGGYRWRNGALTLQLLKVNDDDTAGYTLQPASDLTSGSGTIANAFTVGTVSKDETVWKNNGSGTIVTTTIPAFLPTTGSSGMLYEANIFFHYCCPG